MCGLTRDEGKIKNEELRIDVTVTIYEFINPER